MFLNLQINVVDAKLLCRIGLVKDELICAEF